MDLSREKESVRTSIRNLLDHISPSKQRTRSATILGHLDQSRYFLEARRVFFYYSIPGEVYTLDFLKVHYPEKRFCLPRILNQRMEMLELACLDFKKDNMNIPAPCHGLVRLPRPGDLLLIPGIAFDRQGGRLGRGKGYYDRYLHRCAPGVFKMGVAFSIQILPGVPMDEKDERMDGLLTDDGIILCPHL